MWVYTSIVSSTLECPSSLDSGAYVSSEKYRASVKQLAETQGLLASKTAEYDELKKAAGDNTTLTQQIDQMKADYDKQRQERIAQYINFYNNYRIQTKTKLTPLEKRNQFVA